MKKTLMILLTLLFCMCLAACGDESKTEDNPSEPSSEAPRELVPAFTPEELQEEVDFEKAAESGAYITAESGDVTVSTGQASAQRSETTVPDESVGSLRSAVPPETVWAETPISYGNEEFTLPDAVLMPDGSLGSLEIPEIDLTVPIYETDDAIEAMANGVAHMKETSCWAGNVGLAGHNSGVNTYFANLYKLADGDEIKLTTALGTRTYVVTASEEISESDWSGFSRSDANIITLLTCVNHDGTKRLIVRGEEKV